MRVPTLRFLGAFALAPLLGSCDAVRNPAQPAHPTLSQAATPTILDLGTLGGSRSSALAINERGQVVGTSTTGSGALHAFLWDGTMHDLGTLGGDYSEPRAIDPRGQVVGLSSTASGDRHAFLWDAGTMQDLGPWGAPPATPSLSIPEGRQSGAATRRPVTSTRSCGTAPPCGTSVPSAAPLTRLPPRSTRRVESRECGSPPARPPTHAGSAGKMGPCRTWARSAADRSSSWPSTAEVRSRARA